MQIRLTVNGQFIELDIDPGLTLLHLLRAELGLFSVKHGCETGECGACTVLMDGNPVSSCVMLAAQADGHSIITLEALGEHPEQGWRQMDNVHGCI